MQALGLKFRYVPARLALSRSLSESKQPDLSPFLQEEQSKPIKGENLFGLGVDLATWISLFIEHAQKSDLAKKDLQNLVAGHWHRGAHLLWQEWEGCGKDFDKFLVLVLERGGLQEGEASAFSTFSGDGADPVTSGALPSPCPIDLKLGEPGIDLRTNEPLFWRINGKGTSPHIGIMGASSTGKTRLAMPMVRHVNEVSGCAILAFDMGKGDLAADAGLVKALNATVLSVPDTSIPLKILNVPHRSEGDINTAAAYFRDSFTNAARSGIGAVQQNAIREAARRSLMRQDTVSIQDVYAVLREMYEESGRKEDVVTATFEEFNAYNLFTTEFTPEEFFNRSWIVDVHKAPESVQRLVVFLMLDAADNYLKQLQDAPIDNEGNRSMRLMLVIDEARRVLGYKHGSLVELIRTSRSKGGSVMMISQSPDDFAGENENFLENVGLTVSFRTNATNSKVLQAVFGQKLDLAGLPNGVCVTRLPDKQGVLRIQAWQ